MPLLAHCTSILTSFEGGNPSWKIDKVNLTYWVAVVGNSRNLSNSPCLISPIFPLLRTKIITVAIPWRPAQQQPKLWGNALTAICYIALFFPFWKYRTLCKSSERNGSFPFWELVVWLLRIDKGGQKFLPGRIENGKKTTEPRLLKNRYAPSFPPNLLSITNLIGAAGDMLLLPACPPPVQ